MSVELSRFHTPKPDTAIEKETHRGLRDRDSLAPAESASDGGVLAGCGFMKLRLASNRVPGHPDCSQDPAFVRARRRGMSRTEGMRPRRHTGQNQPGSGSLPWTGSGSDLGGGAARILRICVKRCTRQRLSSSP